MRKWISAFSTVFLAVILLAVLPMNVNAATEGYYTYEVSNGEATITDCDTGISGKTAWKVSQKLAVLGRERQVICITHLPQIAAMADNHFVIEKRAEAHSTQTDIREIGGDDILYELARMLGGAEITTAVVQNAKEMKLLADKIKTY